MISKNVTLTAISSHIVVILEAGSDMANIFLVLFCTTLHSVVQWLYWSALANFSRYCSLVNNGGGSFVRLQAIAVPVELRGLGSLMVSTTDDPFGPSSFLPR